MAAAPFTIKDVAQAAGVSTATVSRVMNRNGYVKDEVRKHVEDVIKQMNYQPNILARSLKQERSRTVGMVLPDMTNPYFMAVARTVQQHLMQQGFHLLYMDSDDNPSKELEAIQVFAGMRTEALILAGTGGNADCLNQMLAEGKTVVLFDRTVCGVQADLIMDDNRSSAKEAMSYLLGKYGPDIGIIRGPDRISTSMERTEGTRQAIAEAGCSPEDFIWFEGGFTRRSGREAGKQWAKLTDRPKATFSYNNEMTYGFYLGLKESGIPLEEVEVVSFGELETAPLFANRLSVIYQNPVKVGEALAEMVADRLEKGRKEREQRIFMPRFERMFH
jgi:LacI family transcriptional regulator